MHRSLRFALLLGTVHAMFAFGCGLPPDLRLCYAQFDEARETANLQLVQVTRKRTSCSQMTLSHADAPHPTIRSVQLSADHSHLAYESDDHLVIVELGTSRVSRRTRNGLAGLAWSSTGARLAIAYLQSSSGGQIKLEILDPRTNSADEIAFPAAGYDRVTRLERIALSWSASDDRLAISPRTDFSIYADYLYPTLGSGQPCETPSAFVFDVAQRCVTASARGWSRAFWIGSNTLVACYAGHVYVTNEHLLVLREWSPVRGTPSWSNPADGLVALEERFYRFGYAPQPDTRLIVVDTLTWQTLWTGDRPRAAVRIERFRRQ